MRKLLIGAVLLTTLSACSSDKTTGPGGSITGNYTLRTANGSNLPAVVYQDQNEKDELTAGNMNLNADNTWSGSLTVRGTDLTTGAVLTLSAPAHGTYTNSGGALTLTDASDGSQLTGSVGGGTLTLSGDIGTGETLTLVFKK